jgi:hypothetical protein
VEGGLSRLFYRRPPKPRRPFLKIRVMMSAAVFQLLQRHAEPHSDSPAGVEAASHLPLAEYAEDSSVPRAGTFPLAAAKPSVSAKSAVYGVSKRLKRRGYHPSHGADLLFSQPRG